MAPYPMPHLDAPKAPGMVEDSKDTQGQAVQEAELHHGTKEGSGEQARRASRQIGAFSPVPAFLTPSPGLPCSSVLPLRG